GTVSVLVDNRTMDLTFGQGVSREGAFREGLATGDLRGRPAHVALHGVVILETRAVVVEHPPTTPCENHIQVTACYLRSSPGSSWISCCRGSMAPWRVSDAEGRLARLSQTGLPPDRALRSRTFCPVRAEPDLCRVGRPARDLSSQTRRKFPQL